MNPTNIFETLTSIQNQFQNPGKKLLQDKLIAIKLDVATKGYRPILAVERRMKGEIRFGECYNGGFLLDK
jgi:hypothetical protein